MPQRTIDWRQKPFADGWDDIEPDAIAWLDIAALDRAWAATDQYIFPGGANGQDNRYKRVGEWFARNSHSDMVFLLITGGGIEFVDGRHRFSWLRDHGVEAIQAQIPPDQEAEILRRFGTALRASHLKV